MRIDRTALERTGITLPTHAGECLRFAAEELQRYLSRMAGVEVACTPDDVTAAHPALRLGRGPDVAPPSGADAFRIAPSASGLTLVGTNERAVLHAVYRLLEELGCIWSFHGPAYEMVPPLPAAGIEVAAVEHDPAFSVRAYVTDIHTYHYHEAEVMASRLPADIAFTDWMGKSGANAFLFIRHPFDTDLTIPALLPEFRKRGIDPEYGGHVLPVLLPREHFAQHQEWFPADREGRRHDLGNLCTASAAALAMTAEGAVDYARRHPEMRVLHIWGADLLDGGWCHCPDCAAWTEQDQSLRVCNAVADGHERAGIDLPVCYLAYYDTIDPDLHLAPHPKVWVEFAPRERCYGHAIDDPMCDVNPRYRDAFQRYMEIFAGRMRIFEYYGDAILFCGIAVPLMRVIEDDLAYYQGEGAREISFLQFGAFSLWAHPLNFLEFAAQTGTQRRSRHDAELATYPAEYWADLERAIAAVVTYGDVRHPPPRRAAEIRAGLEAAIAALRAWTPRLSEDPLAQRELLEYTCTVLEGVVLQLAGTPTAMDEAESRYQRALAVAAKVDDRILGVWGRRDLPVIHSFHSAIARRF